MTSSLYNFARSALRRRLDVLRSSREEDGWALLISLIVAVVMLGFGMAIVGLADTQSRVSATSRQRDEAFQLADAALNAEMFALANAWPGAGSGGNPFPVCTKSSTDTRCPSAAMLTNLMNTPDTQSNVNWQINVYDDGINAAGQSMQTFYSDLYTNGQATYDANGDNKVWVRAEATVGGVTKTVVGMAQAQTMNTPLPRATVISGSLQLSNNGNKTIIDTQGTSAPPPGPVDVRCTTLLNPNCLVYDSSKNQISPDTTSTGYTGGSALNATVQAGLKQEAIANGTYFATCPATPPSGPVVWIDSGNCSYTGNATLNAPGAEGLTILNNATLSIGGTVTYYGLIYALNPSNSSGTVVTIQGNGNVVGAVMIDGNGGLVGGSSKLNLQFDANALGTVNTISTVNYIQSTWRLL